MTASPDTNAEMSAYWDGERGEAWVARADQFDRQLEIYGLRAVSSAAPQPVSYTHLTLPTNREV